MKDYGYMDGYLKKNYGEQQDLEGQADNMTKIASMASAGTDTPAAEGQGQYFGAPSKEFSQGASRGAGGGIGSMLLSGGVASKNPYAAGAGVGMMLLEGNAQAKQAEEEAKAIEAQQRKQAQLSAINSLISVSKGLSVG